MSTKINWTDETWNISIGCEKISPGCQNCYAEKMAYRLAHIEKTSYYQNVIKFEHIEKIGTGYEGTTLLPEWNARTHFVESALTKPVQWKKPRMIFVCSMGDLFHESVKFECIEKVINIIQACPQHTFQILTKRPNRMLQFFDYLYNETHWQGKSELIQNVWLGVTTENQEQADKRIPILLQIPAKVRFVSVEPMLSEIKLYSIKDQTYGVDGFYNALKGYSCHKSYHISKKDDIYKDVPKLDWVICGGESGHNARPMHPDWVRNLKDQCQEANVPFFFKQWGEYTHFSNLTSDLVEGYSGGKISKMNGEFYKVGKKNAGCLLDGKEYKQFPKIS